MLEIQTKVLQPDIVVLEITGRITIGRECKQVEWATAASCVKGGKRSSST
jgi:hypothetical protein